ncbi:MAG: hypothetical protein JJ971_02225 [Balneolaceae bacterium]|nr:hypothetical protein [Balneolaceae bacterium]MBO6545189.1 hypothetical protein [Balneolaceae bacterium]MBO6646585.1 hypothetical protein [Balneolaceae bacterium]
MNIKKTLLYTTVLAFFAITLSINTQAQTKADRGQSALGIMIGDPTGVSFKHWTSSNTAFDAGAAWSLENNDAISLHGDYLWHSYFDVDKGNFAFYYGIGARALFIENADSRIGARVPLGFNYLFEDAPLDLFVEIAPIVDLVPDTDLNGDGAIGLRYYF